jgi:hypothetical protein
LLTRGVDGRAHITQLPGELQQTGQQQEGQ